MKAPTIGIGIVAALALAAPASASATAETGSVVPPGNSAATQYTEAVPTAGGDKPSGGGKKQSAEKVLGSKNVQKLDSQGKAGHEVARVIAETAPETSAPVETAPPREPSSSGANATHQSEQGGGVTSNGRGGDKQTRPPHRPAAPVAESPKPPPTALPNGSSGLSAVIAEASGSSSSGQLGALLPLAILAAIVWSLAFFWRQRRPAD